MSSRPAERYEYPRMSDADNIQRELETSENEDDWTESFPRSPDLFRQRDYGNRIGQSTGNSAHQLERLGLPMANIVPEIQTGIAVDTRSNENARERHPRKRGRPRQHRTYGRPRPRSQTEVGTLETLGLDGMEQSAANGVGITTNSDSISNRIGTSILDAGPVGNSFSGRLQRTQGKLKRSS